MEPKPGEPQVFYRWLNAQGRLHVVSSIEQVPIADRAKAALVVLNGAEAASEYASGSAAAWRLYAVSFALGVAASPILALAKAEGPVNVGRPGLLLYCWAPPRSALLHGV